MKGVNEMRESRQFEADSRSKFPSHIVLQENLNPNSDQIKEQLKNIRTLSHNLINYQPSESEKYQQT
jgi:hypothetical protein